MMARQIQRIGFGVIRLDSDSKRVLRKAVSHFEQQNTFRFPPIPSSTEEFSPKFTEEYKACFNLLYSMGLHALCELLEAVPFTHRGSLPDARVAQQAASVPPFTARDSIPFQSHHSAFEGTFFNIFNYNHGSLNAHRDRCLMTLVWGEHSQPTLPDYSRLWVQPPFSNTGSASEALIGTATSPWIDAHRHIASLPDNGSGSDGVIVFIGEELADATAGFYPAVQHCVRVHPSDEQAQWLADSHHQRDPAAPTIGNRMSVAMVFAQ